MTRDFKIKHEFVEFIPEALAPGVVYVSIPYATSAHSCFCGCGNKVVTPLSRRGWSVTFDGESVSLYPSVGSYSLPCQSHYFVKSDQVVWVAKPSEEEIVAERLRDGLLPSTEQGSRDSKKKPTPRIKRSFLEWLRGS
ncbi:DUF6527 family protein [Bradyrhizobium genosp. A]|uniref:DUF6527 family protein n=1 Tax=Bradyrhizobium genosp. A TaxID=83626 RepID=UPI003CEA8CBE